MSCGRTTYSSCGFAFVNLVLDPDEANAPRRLIRVSPADDAFMTLSALPGPGHGFPARIAGESRLGFRLRLEVRSVALTLDDLRDWDGFDPVYALEEEEDIEISGCCRLRKCASVAAAPFAATPSYRNSAGNATAIEQSIRLPGSGTTSRRKGRPLTGAEF
jgi:hypothetical protein